MEEWRVRNSQVKKKVTAYAIRKERKRSLVEKVAKMQKELDELKFQVLVARGEMDRANTRTQAENVVLHEFIQAQHVTFAATQAAITGHVQRSLVSLQPAQSVVHLGEDRVERRKLLLALKDRKIDYAARYLGARSHTLDPLSSYSHEERFDTPGDDYCITRFEQLPVRGVSTNTVFDAILGSILNAEMFLSEMFGSITVREDNELESSEFAQIRLASAISSGVIVESNTILFSKFMGGAEDGQGSYGIISVDFVDSDALYPYRTGERVRGDTTTIVMVRSLSKATTAGGHHGHEKKIADEKPSEVAITRWSLLKIHRGDSSISQDPERELKESSVCYSNTAMRCFERQLQAAYSS
ncbi:hypothetical protein PHYPSEUDO_014773 [Phytophthora pseudosyringae]|uniref:Uncharacterized protein n=1 Tax=Phytophthora pseudosyringae TaxID=221518 RepID=A0A8T1V6K3_9STRA|nr:hypothetical protein PHYPSEUDO_014773 [Phytophthora pseudosyringae]